MISIAPKTPRFSSFISPNRVFEVANNLDRESILIPAHLVGMPQNMENYKHHFSNRDISRLAEIARKYHATQSLQSWVECLITSIVDGPTITAIGAATILQPQQKITLPNQYLVLGRSIRVRIMGRISCVVTTPGTARIDTRMNNVVMFDTGAMNLNVVAKTNLPFWLEEVFTIRAVGNGTIANAFGFSQFTSEAVVGSPLSSAGSNGTLTSSGGGGLGATAVGAGFDSTAANPVDFQFTQTVATGSFTAQQITIEALN
jgi:hypothetical protein